MDIIKELTKNLFWFLAFLALSFMFINFLNKATYLALKLLEMANFPNYLVF